MNLHSNTLFKAVALFLVSGSSGKNASNAATKVIKDLLHNIVESPSTSADFLSPGPLESSSFSSSCSNGRHIGPLVLDFDVLFEHMQATKSALTYYYTQWEIPEDSGLSVPTSLAATADKITHTDMNTDNLTTTSRALQGKVRKSGQIRVGTASSFTQGIAYNHGGLRNDFILEAIEIFSPSIHVFADRVPLPLEVQLQHRNENGRVASFSLLFREQTQEALQGCTSRRPIIGNVVQHATGRDASATDQKGAERAWTLAAGQLATVVEVDSNGDFRLQNEQGHESGWQYAKQYVYAKEVEAPEELLIWLNRALTSKTQAVFDASKLFASDGRTLALKYIADKPSPPCCPDMLWFIANSVFLATDKTIRDIRSALTKSIPSGVLKARVWNGTVQEQIQLIKVQSFSHARLHQGLSPEEVSARKIYFGSRIMGGMGALTVFTASIFWVPYRQLWPSAPDTMLLLLTSDRRASMVLRILLRSLVYVLFVIMFYLPLMGYNQAQCLTGYPWEIHMLFFAYMLFTRALEIMLVAMVGVRHHSSCKAKFVLYVTTTFKQVISFLATVDMFTDTNFVLIAYSCEWPWWVLALLTYVAGVLLFQCLPKWFAGMYFLFMGWNDDKARLNEMMVWCKLLSLEVLVHYMGIGVEKSDDQRPRYTKPIISKTMSPSYPAEHTQLEPIQTVLKCVAQIDQFMSVAYGEFSLSDRKDMKIDMDNLRSSSEDVSRTRVLPVPDPQKPTKPTEPKKPKKPNKPVFVPEPSKPDPDKFSPLVEEEPRGFRAFFGNTKKKKKQAQEEFEQKLKQAQDDYEKELKQVQEGNERERIAYDARMEDYNQSMEKYKNEMLEYNNAMDKYSKDTEEWNEQVNKLQTERDEFDSELQKQVEKLKTFTGFINDFAIPLQEMEQDKALKEEMEKIKLMANVVDAGCRCFFEDFFQASLQIFFILTFKFNTMVLISIVVGFLISALTAVNAYYERESNEQRVQAEQAAYIAVPTHASDEENEELLTEAASVGVAAAALVTAAAQE